MEKDSDNLNKVLLPNETIVKTVDGKLCRSIGNEDSREIWVQNVFDMPIAGMLLSLNHQTTRQRRNNLLFYITAFGLSIHPEVRTPLGGPVKALELWTGRGRPWIYSRGNNFGKLHQWNHDNFTQYFEQAIRIIRQINF